MSDEQHKKDDEQRKPAPKCRLIYCPRCRKFASETGCAGGDLQHCPVRLFGRTRNA